MGAGKLGWHSSAMILSRDPRSRSPSTRTGAAVAVPAAAAPAAAAVVAGGGRGAGDWQGVPAGTRTAGTVASPTSAGCTTRALVSEPWEGAGGGRPCGAAHPHLLFVPCSVSAPARTHCGQGLVLGHPRCFPLSQTVAKGLLQPSMCLVQPPVPQRKGACPAPGSPSWWCPCCHAPGLAKPQAALSRGRTLNPTPTDTDSSCCLPSLGHSALGAVVWALLLLVHLSGGLAEHWCRFFSMMGHAFIPALPHSLPCCCSPGPSPIWHYILSSSILHCHDTGHLLLLPA